MDKASQDEFQLSTQSFPIVQAIFVFDGCELYGYEFLNLTGRGIHISKSGYQRIPTIPISKVNCICG